MHDGPALEGRINISANCIPSFRAEGNAFCSAMRRPGRKQYPFIRLSSFDQCTYTHMPIIITLIITIKHKFVSYVIAGTFTTIWYRAILTLQFWE